MVEPPSGLPATTHIVLTARVQKAHTRNVSAVVPEQVLSEGDEISLDVDLDRDAYVYVMYVDASGVVSGLFPAAGDTIVARGGQRLPPGKWWRLDAAKGKESFVVFAAARPLEVSLLRDRAASWRPAGGDMTNRPPQTRQTIKKVPAHRRETPNVMSDEHSRSPQEVVEGIEAQPDAVGITTAVLTFDHR